MWTIPQFSVSGAALQLQLPKIWLLKRNAVKVKSISKVMPGFVFYLWRNLWQTFRTAANFLYNSSLSRNTKFLISDQVFSLSLWKFAQMESNCFKTLKLQNVFKMLAESCETRTPLWHHFPKFFKTVSK